MSERIRVLVVDDQPRARQSLRVLLTTCPEVKEVHEAPLAREAMRMLDPAEKLLTTLTEVASLQPGEVHAEERSLRFLASKHPSVAGPPTSM